MTSPISRKKPSIFTFEVEPSLNHPPPSPSYESWMTRCTRTLRGMIRTWWGSAVVGTEAEEDAVATAEADTNPV